jgi:energy-coupling factor transporter ATP-binding protein EcfA2
MYLPIVGEVYGLGDDVAPAIPHDDEDAVMGEATRKSKALPQGSLRTALNTLGALARVEGQEHDLKTRWGRVGKKIYYETSPGRVWEIDADGWRRASDPPVRFRRLDLLRPLPDPVAGGTLEDLTEVIKLEGVSLRMYLSTLASYPFEDVPRPALAIVGKQGGGKSTRTKVLKRLLDEDGSDFVSPQGDILRQATHRAVVAFDNQSSFPKDFSDLLSSLITGGGDSRRELYSNNREFAFRVMRPVVLNGINIPSDRPDLLERTLIVEVPDIRPEERETEDDFWTNFEEKRGVLLGVVFDLISGVLRNLRPLERRPAWLTGPTTPAPSTSIRGGAGTSSKRIGKPKKIASTKRP